MIIIKQIDDNMMDVEYYENHGDLVFLLSLSFVRNHKTNFRRII